MSEAELIQLNHDRKCTLYTIQFLTEDEAEKTLALMMKMMNYLGVS